MREKLDRWLERPAFTNFIVAVIIFNAVLLGMETSPALMGRFGNLILTLDQLCLAIFVVEIFLKITARGFHFFPKWLECL